MEGIVEVMERISKLGLRLRSALVAMSRSAALIWAASCLLFSDIWGGENAVQVEDLREFVQRTDRDRGE